MARQTTLQKTFLSHFEAVFVPQKQRKRIVGLKISRFWPENPQSPQKNRVFPTFFACFGLRYDFDLAIVPFGLDFFAYKMGSENSSAGPGRAGMESKFRRIGKIDGS